MAGRATKCSPILVETHEFTFLMVEKGSGIACACACMTTMMHNMAILETCRIGLELTSLIYNKHMHIMVS